MSLTLLTVLFTPALVPATASAQIKEGLTCGTELNATNITSGTQSACTSSQGNADQKINDIVKLVINIFSWIVGIVAVVMIIVGGLKYITSGGDSSSTGSAKNTILFAVVGLIVVALSQFLVRFVLEKVTS